MGIYFLIKPAGQWLINLSALLIFLSYLLLMFIPLIKVYQERGSIKYFFFSPLSASIDQNIKKESIIDERFVPEFILLGKDTLEIGLMEVRHEREYLNKRINLVAGPVEKLGILPGVISMIITISKPIEGHDWITGLAYGYIALTVLSLLFVNLLVKYDRVIALTEIALSRCNREEY
ncbi:hypothetical protein E05_51130 [Plautia stali symbiont]|nr:hypothetical protein E05_51130 [Plautia stali symbiont]